MNSAPPVTYFEKRRPGPESKLEDKVASRMNDLFKDQGWPVWMGGSVPIGAGKPDLVSVWYQPEVISLAEFSVNDGSILAYLKTVKEARVGTIAEKIRRKEKSLLTDLEQLENLSAVRRNSSDNFSLAPSWRKILPQIVTVEAKMTDWRRALQQALRNRIFADRSYVAVPFALAQRIAKDAGYVQHGVGIIGVHENGEIEICKPARRSEIRVWEYYFHLAGLTAKNLANGIHR